MLPAVGPTVREAPLGTLLPGEEPPRRRRALGDARDLEEISTEPPELPSESPSDASDELFLTGVTTRTIGSTRVVECHSSCFCHQPLYFEEFRPEVLGQTRHPCLQPLRSGAHFFGTVAVMPCKLGVVRPWQRVPACPCVRRLGSNGGM